MELLVFGTSGERMLVFPSRMGRFYEHEDHGMIHSLRHVIDAGRLQLICVDSVDEESLYCFDKTPEERLDRHIAYERYLVDEVLPFSAGKNPGSPLSAHGCSLGAYHAATIALRHPKSFSRVLAFSGRYDLTLHATHYHSLFHGYYTDRLRDVLPSHFVPLMTEQARLDAVRKLRFTLVVGEDDPFFQNNQDFSRALSVKGVANELHVWYGEAHRFRYWRQMARIYF